MNQRSESTHAEVAEKQAMPVAGIWACNDCGRRIQIILDSTVPKKQAFTCVCGAAMEPGEEHVEVDGDSSATKPDVNPDVLKR